MAGNVSQKKYLTAFINNSPTVRENAGADITNAAHKAVMYDDGGNAVLATAGDKAVGVVLSTARSNENDAGDALLTKKGMAIDILVKDIGLIEAAGAIKKGDALTVNAGRAAVAAAGDFIFGWAFSSAVAAGELVHIQITKSGRYN